MTARVLVVDDLLPNVKLLEAKLNVEYYEVITARSGAEGIEKAKTENPDIILLDVMMPEMDGYETCRRLKADPTTKHIPVVMVTALSELKDRVKGLEAGADDFLTKPVNDVALFARIRSLVRLKTMLDELRLRNQTGEQFGLVDDSFEQQIHTIDTGKVLVVDDDVVQSRQFLEQLTRPSNTVELVDNPSETLTKASQGDYDLIIISTQLAETDGIRLCSQLRSQAGTRNTPILILLDEEERQLAVKGLDMGVNDYLVIPSDPNELVARVNTQIRRKHFQDALKDNYQKSVSMAVTDGLTGLYNRGYLEAHYANAFRQASEQRKPVSVMMTDIDHFKKINDTYGHQVGDDALKEVARRVLASVRNSDLVARYGGEEFLVVTSAPVHLLRDIGERIRATIAAEPIISTIDGKTHTVPVTTSIGIATIRPGDTPEGLLHRADECLYEAKEGGRNRLVSKDLPITPTGTLPGTPPQTFAPLAPVSPAPKTAQNTAPGSTVVPDQPLRIRPNIPLKPLPIKGKGPKA
ncbi:MAG: pleD 2 [Rickettsiales bacterium]|jgi:two-component system cell cycle response regulator|nr:pleD 2 [Rickettsiales bacterium]